MSTLLQEYVLTSSSTANSSTAIGRCVIINNEHFRDTQHFKPRRGTDLDENVLKDTFSAIGFEVDVFRNLRATEMMSVFRRRDVNYHSCLVVCVLTHGARDLVYGTDGVPLNIWSHVVTEFCGVRCEELIGRPKMFLLQACQGSELMSGGEQLGDSVQLDGHLLPECSDCLVALPAPPGFAGVRSPTTGSPLVQTFCRLLKQHHKDHSLLNILTAVNQEVANLSFSISGDEGKCQPKVEFTLTKELFIRHSDTSSQSDNINGHQNPKANTVIPEQLIEPPESSLTPPSEALQPHGLQAILIENPANNSPTLVTVDPFGWSTGLLFLRLLRPPSSTQSSWSESRQQVRHSSKTRSLEAAEVHGAAADELLLALTYSRTPRCSKLLRLKVSTSEVLSTRKFKHSSLHGVCYDPWQTDMNQVWICSTKETTQHQHGILLLRYEDLKPLNTDSKSSVQRLFHMRSSAKVNVPGVLQPLKVQVNGDRLVFLDLDKGHMYLQVHDKTTLEPLFRVPDIRNRLHINQARRRLQSFALMTPSNWLIFVRQSDHKIGVWGPNGDVIQTWDATACSVQDGKHSELTFHRVEATGNVIVEQRLNKMSNGVQPYLSSLETLMQHIVFSLV